MADTNTIAHGGALDAAVAKYGGNKAGWLDLSTGINPVPAPIPRFAEHVWQALPDTDLMENCLNAARNSYHFPQSAALIAAPGVQAIIQLLPNLRPGKKAAIFSPTYGEYAHVFQTLGGGSRIINTINDVQDETVVILVNPNNPDGKIVPPDVLINLANSLADKGGLLIVDEAFCDLTPEVSVKSYAGMRGLLVLKSFGKFFGLAGVRLGFAAGHADDIAILNRHLGPWAVSGPALTIGAACLRDREMHVKTALSIRTNSTAQRAVFEQLGLTLIADTGLFHLINCPDASAVYEALAHHRILTRIFADRPNWLRLGLCKNDVERARLASALSAGLGT